MSVCPSARAEARLRARGEVERDETQGSAERRQCEARRRRLGARCRPRKERLHLAHRQRCGLAGVRSARGRRGCRTWLAPKSVQCGSARGAWRNWPLVGSTVHTRQPRRHRRAAYVRPRACVRTCATSRAASSAPAAARTRRRARAQRATFASGRAGRAKPVASSCQPPTKDRPRACFVWPQHPRGACAATSAGASRSPSAAARRCLRARWQARRFSRAAEPRAARCERQRRPSRAASRPRHACWPCGCVRAPYARRVDQVGQIRQQRARAVACERSARLLRQVAQVGPSQLQARANRQPKTVRAPASSGRNTRAEHAPQRAREHLVLLRLLRGDACAHDGKHVVSAVQPSACEQHVPLDASANADLAGRRRTRGTRVGRAAACARHMRGA